MLVWRQLDESSAEPGEIMAGGAAECPVGGSIPHVMQSSSKLASRLVHCLDAQRIHQTLLRGAVVHVDFDILVTLDHLVDMRSDDKDRHGAVDFDPASADGDAQLHQSARERHTTTNAKTLSTVPQ